MTGREPGGKQARHPGWHWQAHHLRTAGFTCPLEGQARFGHPHRCIEYGASFNLPPFKVVVRPCRHLLVFVPVPAICFGHIDMLLRLW
jgi:hypothetical protein